MNFRTFALALGALAAGGTLAVAAAPAPAKAVFAGGCFWCMESAFDAVPGVLATTSGYAGGADTSPTYEEVSSGTTGHRESLEVTYDPAKVSYQKLLDVFWRNVDPFDATGQFCDHGPQYRSAIFAADGAERKLADASKRTVEARFGRPVATEILPASKFWPAEDYHQDYYEKNPIRYKFYRHNCGRDARLKELWGAEAGGGH